jgi:hypothetical protein
MIGRKKECELRVLAAARSASSFFPSREIIIGETLDFRIKGETATVGIELTELLPLPRNDSFNSPLAEESLHRDVVRLAEEDYYRTPGVTAVKVTVYFWDVERGKNRKREMARALSAFVSSHREQAISNTIAKAASFAHRALMLRARSAKAKTSPHVLAK